MSAPTVELVYERDCPNIEPARALLRRVLPEAGLPAHWQEWALDDLTAPAHVRGRGSPTILVNGRDVAGDEATGSDACCRIYAEAEPGCVGVPARAVLLAALAAAGSGGGPVGHHGAGYLKLAVLPSIALSLLPTVACAACWPAYAGLLGALGLGFFDYTPYLRPLTVLAVLIALVALGYRAGARHGPGPLLLGLPAAGLLLAGRVLFDSPVTVYLGLALLVAASLWNAWPVAGGTCALLSRCRGARRHVPSPEPSDE